MDKKLTYFTPTYNRAHLLPNLYKSLCDQTNKDFIWLIVDDGSTDNTKELIESWIKENVVEIQYEYKKNGGKHTAIEYSNDVCKTEFITCIDSDDYLSAAATEVLYKYFDELRADCSLCGIVGRRAHYDGKPFNESWPKLIEKLYFKDLVSVYGYTQDTMLLFKADFIKNYHFPIFSDERFVTESVFYQKFMYDYKLLAIPECVYLAEYQEDGYSAQGMKLFYKNPKGFLYALKQNYYYAKQNGKTFKQRLFMLASVYAWKNANNIKDDYPNDYKIKFPFNVIGKLLAKTKLKNYYKKEENGGN